MIGSSSRRTAFAMIAGAAVHLKKEPDETLLAWLPLIENAFDRRTQLRVQGCQLGAQKHWKAQPTSATPMRSSLAERLSASADKTARWIGKDAVRELASERIFARLKD